MILLDTNVVIEFFKGREPVRSALDSLPAADLAISHATHAEMVFGAFDKRELQRILAGLHTLVSLPITSSISHAALQLMEAYCLSNRLSLPDALIAATALHHSLPLYTLNRKDFRYIPNLNLYEPV